MTATIPQFQVQVVDPRERGFRVGVDILDGLVPLRPRGAAEFVLNRSRLGDARLGPIPKRMIWLDLTSHAVHIRSRHGNADAIGLPPDPGTLEASLINGPDLSTLGITPGTPVRLRHDGQDLWAGHVSDLSDTWDKAGSRYSTIQAADAVAAWSAVTRHGASNRLGNKGSEPAADRLARLIQSAPSPRSLTGTDGLTDPCVNTVHETSLTNHLQMACVTARRNWTLHRGHVRVLDAAAQTHSEHAYTDTPARYLTLTPPLSSWAGVGPYLSGGVVRVPRGQRPVIYTPWVPAAKDTPVMIRLLTHGLTDGVVTYARIIYRLADGTTTPAVYPIANRTLTQRLSTITGTDRTPATAVAAQVHVWLNHDNGTGGGQYLLSAELLDASDDRPTDSYYAITRAAGTRQVISSVDLTTHMIGDDGNANDVSQTVSDPTAVTAYGTRSATADVTAPLNALDRIGQWLLAPTSDLTPTVTQITINGATATRADGTPLRPLDPITVHRLGRRHRVVIASIEHDLRPDPRTLTTTHRTTLYLVRMTNG